VTSGHEVILTYCPDVTSLSSGYLPI